MRRAERLDRITGTAAEVRERGRAAVGPVAEMMPLSEAKAAPREAAALVPMVEGTA
jgi:hypothetical protein